MQPGEIILLIISGILVGFINTLAGGGSIVSLSVLMILGLPPGLANGTNRIGIAIQTFTAAANFKKQKVLPVKKALLLSIPAIAGSIIGSWIAVDINEDAFKTAIGIIMLVMMIFIVFNPQKYIYGRKDIIKKPLKPWVFIVFFFLGIYGGFLHMGIGYFLLATIVLGTGYDLVKANAMKVLIILIYTPFTLAVFIFNNQIDWSYGLLLSLGTVIGAFIASNMAVKKGVAFVKWVIIIVILTTSGEMFGLYNFDDIWQLFIKG
jgi:uncharacterized membrane protein YfcA